MSDAINELTYQDSWQSPQTMDQLMKRILVLGGDVTSRVLNDLINGHTYVRYNMELDFERYRQSSVGVPIMTRELANPDKVNSKLPDDFFGDVVDTKVGYMGQEVIVALDKEAYTVDGELAEARFDADTKVLGEYQTTNTTIDQNAELLKMAAITGTAARLLYVDKNGELRIMNPDPWECIWIYDRSIFEPQYAMRYYPVKVTFYDENGTEKEEERWRVEWYDSLFVTFFIQTGAGKFTPDLSEENVDVTGRKLHMFDGIPLLPFINNEEKLGDCAKVKDLIDGYDRAFSDVNSEIEQLRLAYMYLKGSGLVVDDELLEKMEQTGVFPLPTDGDIGFATKSLDDGIIENHLNRLERNIMRFAKSVDFSDPEFASGGLPVIAFKIKLMGLESKAKITENKFRRSFREQYKLITDFWRTANIADIDYLDLMFQFPRNVPQNLLETAQVIQILRGHVSLKTLLGELPMVQDPEKELLQLEAEKEGEMDFEEDEDEEEPEE